MKDMSSLSKGNKKSVSGRIFACNLLLHESINTIVFADQKRKLLSSGGCRIVEELVKWVGEFLAQNGVTILYLGTFVILVVCGMGVPFPEEATFLVAGYAAAKIPNTNLWILCIAGVIGIIVGDSIPFYVGRRYGLSLLSRPFIAKILTPERIERTKEYFRKHGAKTVFAGRFVAGLRMPTFFMAASMGVRYRTFVFWDMMGALISCPTSIVLAYYLGPKAEEYLHQSKIYMIIFACVVAAYGVYHYLSHRHKPPTPPASGTAPLPPSHGSSGSENASNVQRAEVTK
jgi:membrane protein DedA with SNARE-associated domain